MKKLLIYLLGLYPFIFTFSQVPDKVNYQAVIRDNNGELIRNQSIRLRISILQGSTEGTSVYEETHDNISNSFGLINLNIGAGTILNGNLSSINWGSNQYFLKIELKNNVGADYKELGITQLVSVPYSLHSQTADSVINDRYALFKGATIPTDTHIIDNSPFYRKALTKPLTYYNEVSGKFNSIRYSLNIKDFGAIGDSVSDDFLSIKKAIDSLKKISDVSKVLYIPQGKYNIGTNRLELPSDLLIQGEGSETSIISGSGSIIIDAKGKKNLKFFDLGIEIVGTNNFYTGINVDNCENVFVERCYIYRTTEPTFGETIHAVLARGIRNIFVSHNKIKFSQVKLAGANLRADRCYIMYNHFYRPYNFAISSVGTKNNAMSREIYIIGNIIHDIPSKGAIFLGADGENTQPADTISDIYILNNIIKGQWRFVPASLSSNVGIDCKLGVYNQNIHIKQNSIENTAILSDNSWSIVIKPTNSDNPNIIKGLFIENNFLGKNAKYGLSLSAKFQEGIFIHNNVISENLGIRIFSSDEGISNLQISNNSLNSASILINQSQLGKIKGFSITNNTFTANSTRAYAIQLNRILNTDFSLIILNNEIFGYQKGIEFIQPSGDSGRFYGNASVNHISSTIPYNLRPPSISFEGNSFTKEPRMGRGILDDGILTVNTAEVRTGDVIRIFRLNATGSIGILHPNNIINGVSFDIVSTSSNDTSEVFWEIVH